MYGFLYNMLILNSSYFEQYKKLFDLFHIVSWNVVEWRNVIAKKNPINYFHHINDVQFNAVTSCHIE